MLFADSARKNDFLIDIIRMVLPGMLLGATAMVSMMGTSRVAAGVCSYVCVYRLLAYMRVCMHACMHYICTVCLFYYKQK